MEKRKRSQLRKRVAQLLRGRQRWEQPVQSGQPLRGLFEEPGTLAEAALLARDWFERYLMAQHDQPLTQVAQ